MTDEALVIRARNWEALCRYGWHPYMHNPQLKRWLSQHRCADVGALGRVGQNRCACLWRSLCKTYPRRAFRVIADAGHHPEIEQPAALAERVIAFIQQ